MKKSVNELEKQYSGIFGAEVAIKNRKGKSVMVMKTTKAEVPPSEGMLKQRRRFAQAATYSHNILLNPEMRIAYEMKASKLLPAFQVAVKDFMLSPSITEIDVNDYEGKSGDKIHVTAYDDFAVTEVTVTIQDPSGVVIEKGKCVLNPFTSNFDYTATVELTTSLTGVVIIAKARDYPGHLGADSITLQ